MPPPQFVDRRGEVLDPILRGEVRRIISNVPPPHFVRRGRLNDPYHDPSDYFYHHHHWPDLSREPPLTPQWRRPRQGPVTPSPVHGAPATSPPHTHPLHHNRPIDLCSGNYSEDAIRDYIHTPQWGTVEEVNIHYNNVRVSLLANQDATNGKRICYNPKCEKKRKKPIRVYIGCCLTCFSSLVTRFTFEDIMTKEITMALSDFVGNRILPYGEVNDYLPDLYRISPVFGLQMVEIDSTAHHSHKIYAVDASRTQNLHEAHYIHGIGNDTPACTLRFLRGEDRIPTVEECDCVIQTLGSRFRNVPDYVIGNDIVLLVGYNAKTLNHAKQIRRYLSIFGPIVLRGCNHDGSGWVFTDFNQLLYQQILGKYYTLLYLHCIALM